MENPNLYEIQLCFKETEEEKQKIINTIKAEIPYIDVKPYSHNIIQLELDILEKHYGIEEVLKLIETTELKNLGWGYILKMNE